MKEYFFVGTYTEPILFGTGEVFRGKGKGIYLCALEDGKIQILEQIGCRNPSYLCVDPEKRKVYAVNEMKEYNGEFGGGITQLSYAGGTMAAELEQGTGGTDPCHVALAPNGQFLAVANYSSGAVTIFPLDDQGNLGERQVFQHHGSSVHPARQRGPHAHAILFLEGEKLMFVPDLGMDVVKAYRYEGSTVTPAPDFDIAVSAGSGPRSGVFSHDGRFFYLIHEISCQVSCYACDHGRMTLMGYVETLPEAEKIPSNTCSDLHLTPDGRYLYASVRGHNSLCCFRVEEDGTLTLLHRIPCGGKTPRNFAIDPTGKFLLVGNQDSNTIALFAIREDGSLTELGLTEFGSPVCIRFFDRSL